MSCRALFGLRPFVKALGHELANDGIDVAICAEAKAQRSADIERTRPCADDVHDAPIEFTTNMCPYRGARHALETVQHFLGRDGQTGKVHCSPILEIGRLNARRMHEIGCCQLR